MATHAPITGAPTRAPNSDANDRPASDVISDIQMLLYHAESLLFASALAFNDMGGFADKHQSDLVGHADNLAQITVGLIERMQGLAEELEVRLAREGR